MASLMAYQNLDALTFNVLNQTKTLSAALCCYLVMGRRQSGVQVVALMVLLLSALVMEGIVPMDKLIFGGGITSKSASETIGETEEDRNLLEESNGDAPLVGESHFWMGVIPIMVASFISGLAGALTQRSLQAATGARNSYLFSMELCAATSIMVSTSLLFSPDGQRIVSEGFWLNWTPQTWIPIFTGASGGVLVGLVTKHAGSVRKGFALIFGMLIAALLQAAVDEQQSISAAQLLGGVLAASSLYLHATNPPKPKLKQS